jgi:hypothetical protein
MLLPEELGLRLSVAAAGRNSLPSSLVGIIPEVGFLREAQVCSLYGLASVLTGDAGCGAWLGAHSVGTGRRTGKWH